MNIILQSLGVDIPLALISLIASLVIIALGALFGALRGVHRSALRIAAIVLSLVIAFFIALPHDADEIYHEFVAHGANYMPEGQEIPETLFTLIAAYASAVAAPIVFLALFIILNLLFWAVFGIIGLVVFPGKKYKSAKKADNTEATAKKPLPRVRWAGALIGTVSALVLVAGLNLPVYGYAELATTNFAPVFAEIEDDVSIENKSTFADALTKVMFGDKMFDRLTTSSLHGEKMRFADHADNLSTLIVSAIHVATRPVQEWEEQEREALGFFFDVATEDVFGEHTTDVIADGVQTYLVESDIIGQALEKSPAIRAAFDNVINDLDHHDDESFDNLLRATEEIVLLSVDAIQHSEDGTLDAKKFITDSHIAKDTITVIVTTPELDEVTMASVDFGLDKMAKEMGLDEIGHVDVEAWNNISEEEREKEAELLAKVIPEVVEFKTDENGEEHMSFNYGEAMLGLRDSVLVGEIVEDALEDVATNYVEDVTNGELSHEDIPDFVWDLIDEFGISLPSIPGLQ